MSPRRAGALVLGLAASLITCGDSGPTQPDGPFRFTILRGFGAALTPPYRTYPYDIDPTGRVVGMAEQESPRDVFRGAMWHTSATPVSLDAGGVVLLVAYGINAVGQVVGVGGCGEMSLACLWEAGELKDLGSSGYDGFSEPLAINNDGDAVGWAQVLPRGVDHAVLWRDGVVTDLGTLGGLQSQALDIDNRGRVVGWARLANPDDGSPSLSRHAFLWEAGTMRDIDTFGGDESIAFAINDSGQVVGWSSWVSGRRAFLWEAGTMGLLPGSESSQALDINNRSDVIGFYIVSGTTHHAALWRDGQRYDLNDLVGDPRVCLNWANAINDAGQIVGVGAWKSDGREFGFLLTPTGTW
jgi:probable HAF family extracellular repeat protein